MKKRRKASRRSYTPHVVSHEHLALFALVVGILGMIYVLNFVAPALATP